jgi:hypothetical protein
MSQGHINPLIGHCKTDKLMRGEQLKVSTDSVMHKIFYAV